MNIEKLRKRLGNLKAATFQEAIILEDGTKWIPRVPLLDMLVNLLDFTVSIQLGKPSDPVPLDVREDAGMWAKYKPIFGESAYLRPHIAAMAKELVEVDKHEA